MTKTKVNISGRPNRSFFRIACATALILGLCSCETPDSFLPAAATPPKIEVIDRDLRFDDWPGLSHGDVIPIWPYGQKTLKTALDKWASSAGFSIPTPRLMLGSCFVIAAEACADRGTNTIVITSLYMTNPDRQDPLAIMLHEVGHLYGVPHIERDPLMASGVSPHADTPSMMAVAIAKAVHHLKK